MEATLEDVSSVIRLVREVCDLWDDPAAGRERLLQGACRLLNGNVGIMLSDYQPQKGWFGSLGVTAVVGLPPQMRAIVQPTISLMAQRQFADVSENFLPGIT